MPLPRHHYSPGVMRLFVEGLLVARAGQRCLAAVLQLVAPWLPGGLEMPCANTGRLWLLRLGLFELSRPKPKADDWVWIMDHTVQLGTLKVLVVVGVRLSAWEPRRGPLRHEDVALLLQSQLEKDPRWGRFISAVNQTRARVGLTELACLGPPRLKPKARYMNLSPLVRWGQRTLAFLDHPREVPGQPIEQQRLEEKLGWLRDYRQALYDWSVLLAIAETTEHYVRQEGYHTHAAEQLRQHLDGRGINAAARAMETAAVEFVADQSRQARPGERLIGSSEVIESLIGKYKQLQGTHRQGGVTPMVLALGAMVADHTGHGISTALEKIRTCDVLRWCREHLGFTLQAQRRYAFEEQKRDTKLLPSTASF